MQQNNFFQSNLLKSESISTEIVNPNLLQHVKTVAINNDIKPMDMSHSFNPNNRILTAAQSLLDLISQLHYLSEANPAENVRAQLSGYIQTFEQQAKYNGVPAMHVLSARYVLCTVIDEVVFNSQWSNSNNWAEQSLLTMFHQDTWGGETCFELIERWQQQPTEHIELLELMFVVLSLGFKGKYQLRENGRDQLETLRQSLYLIIQRYRNTIRKPLSQKIEHIHLNKQSWNFSGWTVAIIAVVVVGMLFVGYHHADFILS